MHCLSRHELCYCSPGSVTVVRDLFFKNVESQPNLKNNKPHPLIILNERNKSFFVLRSKWFVVRLCHCAFMCTFEPEFSWQF
uniref:Uncharacterized protein n=1 Tax=Anguilla anguilla TaxID=7936 RepID=A0A0E9TS36_ANGAN